MSIKFGPAGMGSIKEAVSNLEGYHKLGLRACEIAFTYGVYIKRKEDAEKIRKAAEKYDIELSIHAPYWINLNSDDREKVEASKKRILDSCEVGQWLGAKRVIFHCGFYEKKSREESYENIKARIIEMQKEIEKNKWHVKLAPETMGKVNVFGSVEEIARLAREIECDFCLDFAHILAREKRIDIKKIKKLFPQKHWHCHFSGIEYGERGEKHHKKTEEEFWKKLLEILPKKKRINIINESPSPVEDSVLGLRLHDNEKQIIFH